MNAKFKFIAVILAVATLASCGKITPTGGGSNEGGTEQGGGNTDPGTVPDTPLREISVAFNTKSTRTYLAEGGKPEFNIGDYIKVAQANGGAAVKEYQIEEIHGGKLGFKTDLQGALVAVYPAGNALENNDHTQITGVSVPSVQSGLFEDANICMADQSKESPQNLNHLQFHNQTALFAVKVPENTAYIEVTSLGRIGMDPLSRNLYHYYRNEEKAPITTDSSNPYTIKVKSKYNNNWELNQTGLPDGHDYKTDTYYVSVFTGEYDSNHVSLVSLNFDVLSQPQDDINYNRAYDDDGLLHLMGGISPKKVYNAYKTDGYEGFSVISFNDVPYCYAKAGRIYYLPSDALHEYVIVDGFICATKNIGASSYDASGFYFSWADRDGQRYEDGKWINMKEYGDAGFDSNGIPYHETVIDGPDYFRYSREEEQILDLFDDAAFYNWGGAWRMPTAEDFSFLVQEAEWNYENNLFIASLDDQNIFFPAAGYAEYDNVKMISELLDGWSGYWSSSLCLEHHYFDDEEVYYNEMAFQLSLSKYVYPPVIETIVDVYYRATGMPIRPVSGVSPEPDEPDVVPGITGGSLPPYGKEDL